MKLQNFINGQFVDPYAGEFLDGFCPGTGEVYCQIPASDAKDINAAVASAETAFLTWSATPARERSEILHRISAGIKARLDEFAEAESRDQGKPVWLAKAIDIPRACHNFEFFSGAILHHTDISTEIPNHVNYCRNEPIGVAGLISPWNLPLYLLTWKIAPAIAVGNTCVCKPSEITSMTAFLLCQVMKEVGVPDGVVNIVFGTGPAAGSALVSHPQVPLISFTGGTKTGEIIQKSVAPYFKKVSLELGGKNASIIFDDADLEACLNTSVRASFLNQGEICLACSRIFVHKKIYDVFLERFVQMVKSFKCGDPAHPDTKCGAVASAEHRDKILSYIELAKTEGGKVECGGSAPEGLNDSCKNGYYVAPTVITGLGPKCTVNMEEIFGPVCTVYPFEDEAEVVEWANCVQYGLSASVWTENSARVHRVAHKLKAGTVWVNCWLVRDLRVPFGGFKASGVGREGGQFSLEFFTEQKTICIHH